MVGEEEAQAAEEEAAFGGLEAMLDACRARRRRLIPCAAAPARRARVAAAPRMHAARHSWLLAWAARRA